MSQRILMASPEHFRVEYEINPWMNKDMPVDPVKALDQWIKLKSAYENIGAEVSVLPADPDLPDLVFTTDGSLTFGGDTMLANFKTPHRRREVEIHEAWHARNTGNRMHRTKYAFEGGDAVYDTGKFLMGHGFRTEQDAHLDVQETLGVEVISLELVDPRYYHLDTALAVLSRKKAYWPKDSAIAYYPGAFSEESREKLADLYEHRIEVDETEAERFSLNSINISGYSPTLITPIGSFATEQAARVVFQSPVKAVDVSEFKKGGGGIKCMTNILY